MTTNFDDIAWRLQNPETEADRLSAFGELTAYLKANPDDINAKNYYNKYRSLTTDFTKQLVSA